MTEERLTELFRNYKESGDISIRNEIAEHYLYIADILAKKFTGRGVEYDDLKQVASYALLHGIDGYDPDHGVKFTTYITPTITGTIKNYFRDSARLVKLPRRLGELNMAVKKFSGEYEAKTGEKPTAAVIAKALSISEEEVVKAMEIGGTLSLDGMSAAEDENDKSLYDLLADGEEGYERFETKEALRSAMKYLSDTQKQLVKYRFVDELSQSETAKRLGVSQMFVSRMEKKTLEKLRDVLKDSF
jgi:RNA polymerase sigma-B factor